MPTARYTTGADAIVNATLSQRLTRLGRGYAAHYRLRRCNAVGAGAEVWGPARIVNRGRIMIGARFRLRSEPVVSHLLAERGGVIEIGDDVSVGHGSGISASGRIRIGSGCRLGAFVLAMDTDYHVAGDFSSSADIVPLEIGSNVCIGNRVTILRGSTIGDGARVLDGSVVRGIVAPGEVVQGVPARAATKAAAFAGTGSAELRVLCTAQATFRLDRLPELTDGPSQLEAWDSLGALSFLLALESEFGILIGEDQMGKVRCLADAVVMVASASAIEAP